MLWAQSVTKDYVNAGEEEEEESKVLFANK